MVHEIQTKGSSNRVFEKTFFAYQCFGCSEPCRIHWLKPFFEKLMFAYSKSSLKVDFTFRMRTLSYIKTL